MVDCFALGYITIWKWGISKRVNFDFNYSECQENWILNSAGRVCNRPTNFTCVITKGPLHISEAPATNKRRPFDFSSRAGHLALSFGSNQANVNASSSAGESIERLFKIWPTAIFRLAASEWSVYFMFNATLHFKYASFSLPSFYRVSQAALPALHIPILWDD